MKTFLKYLAFAIGFLLLAFLGLMLFMTLIFGDSRGCGGDSEAAKYAKSLTQERLAKLYSDMGFYYHQAKEDHDDLAYYDTNAFPEGL